MEEELRSQAVAPTADEVSVWPGDLDEQFLSELLSDGSLLGADVDDSEYYSCNTGGAAAAPSNSGAAEQPPTSVSRPALCPPYTGPTIRDIEKALAARPYLSGSRYRSSLYWFGASSSTAAENKLATKVRSCGGKMPTDGYKWRKYGQKFIKNNPHPRSYYKCTSSRCGAKRQVEKSTDNPDMLIVTYEGTHHHGPQPLFRRPSPPVAPNNLCCAAADGVVYTTMARPSPTSDDGTGAGVAGCAETVYAAAGAKLEHGRVGRHNGSAWNTSLTPPRATMDSCVVDGVALSVLHGAGAALPLPCFPNPDSPMQLPCFDFPWSPEAQVHADDLNRLED